MLYIIAVINLMLARKGEDVTDDSRMTTMLMLGGGGDYVEDG